MEINKIKRSLLVLFFSFLAIGAQAQLEQAVKKIFAGDTITGGHVPLKRDSDSIHLYGNIRLTAQSCHQSG